MNTPGTGYLPPALPITFVDAVCLGAILCLAVLAAAVVTLVLALRKR